MGNGGIFLPFVKSGAFRGEIQFSFIENVQILGIVRKKNVLLVPGGAFRGGIQEVTDGASLLGKISSAKGLPRAGLEYPFPEGFQAMWM